MTAKKLIQELKKMPPNAQVAFRSHDNYEYEIQGWAKAVDLMRKKGADALPAFQREQIDSLPAQYVRISC